MRAKTILALGMVLVAGILNVSCGGSDSPDTAAGGPSPQNLSLSLSRSSGSAAPGSSLTGSVQVSAPSGFTGTVALAAANLPAGVTAVFDPPTVSFPGAGTSTFTLVVPANAAPAAAQAVTLLASGGGFDANAALTLTVQAGNSPAAGFQVDLSNASLGLTPGSSADTAVTLTGQGGFAGTVNLALAGLPAGVTATITPASVTLGATPVNVTVHLTADASAGVTASAASASLTAQGAGLSQSASLAVSVLSAGSPIVARTNTLNAVKDYYSSVLRQGGGDLTIANSMSSFMSARAEFSSAGVDTDTATAWGILKDGAIVVVGSNWELSASGAAKSAPSSFASGTLIQAVSKAAIANPGAGLPVPPNARVMHSFQANTSPDSAAEGWDGGAALSTIRSYLSDGGYSVRAGDASAGLVSSLMKVRDDGVFLLNAHGARVPYADIQASGAGPTSTTLIFAVSTSSQPNATDDSLYAADIAEGRVVYFVAQYGNYETTGPGAGTALSTEVRYGITSRFVDKYMKFAQDSVVMLMACWTGFKPEDFVNTFVKPQVGAGAVVSSRKKLRTGFAYPSYQYFVDRLLGANKLQPESPPQRAFPADLVWADMANKGLLTDSGNGNNLVLTLQNPARPPILTPSIQNLAVNEKDETLTLVGFFGGTGSSGMDGSKVTVDAIPLNCPQWDPGKIVCNLPAPGQPGSKGKVVVELPGGNGPRQSNPRWLNQWDIPLEYSWADAYGNKGWRFDAVGTLRYRGDVGSYRVTPGGQPVFPVRGMVPTKDSGLAVVASGSYFDGSCLNTLSGSATFKPWNTSTMLSSWLKVDTLNKTGSVSLLFGGVPLFPFVNTKSGSDANCSGTEMYLPNFGLLEGLDTFPSPLVDVYDATDPLAQSATIFGLTFNLSTDFNIRSKTFSQPFTGKSGGTISIGWGDVAHQPAELQGVLTPR